MSFQQWHGRSVGSANRIGAEPGRFGRWEARIWSRLTEAASEVERLSQENLGLRERLEGLGDR